VSELQAPRESRALKICEWLESPYLARAVARVAHQYGVPSQDVSDLLQEVRLALWKAGSDLTVNITWIFHTANHKAIDFVKRKAQLAEKELLSQSIAPHPWVDPALLQLLRARAALLPRRLHDFYRLRYEEGFSQREIARRLGLCRSSVRCLDRRCLKMMKGRLAC
jgi:RNA polymerase sigma factor (sigma-70 family)